LERERDALEKELAWTQIRSQRSEPSVQKFMALGNFGEKTGS
jgi:hypothetical protein